MAHQAYRNFFAILATPSTSLKSASSATPPHPQHSADLVSAELIPSNVHGSVSRISWLTDPCSLPSVHHIDPQDTDSPHSCSESTSSHSAESESAQIPKSATNIWFNDNPALDPPRSSLPPMIDFHHPKVPDLDKKALAETWEGMEKFDPWGDYAGRTTDFIVWVARCPPVIQSQMRVANPTEQDEEVEVEKLEYRIVKCLGRGGQGVILLLESVSGAIPHSLVMKVPNFRPRGHYTDLRREIAIARWLGDPRVPDIYKAAFPGFQALRGLNEGLRFAIFMEPMKQSLLDLLRDVASGCREEPLVRCETEKDRTDIEELFRERGTLIVDLLQVVLLVQRAFRLMFGHDVVNLDLKPENILVDFEYGLRMTDLGLLRAEDELRGEDLPGTEAYQPPEIVVQVEERRRPLWDCANDQWIVDLHQTMIQRDIEVWGLGACCLIILHPTLYHSPWHDHQGKKFLWSFTQRKLMEQNFSAFLGTHLAGEIGCNSLNRIISRCFAKSGDRPSIPWLLDEVVKCMMRGPFAENVNLCLPAYEPPPPPAPIVPAFILTSTWDALDSFGEPGGGNGNVAEVNRGHMDENEADAQWIDDGPDVWQTRPGIDWEVADIVGEYGSVHQAAEEAGDVKKKGRKGSIRLLKDGWKKAKGVVLRQQHRSDGRTSVLVH